jgi:hypothetical protein
MAGMDERRDNQSNAVRRLGDPYERALECSECVKLAESGGKGWRGYLDHGDVVVLFCPECTEREFGESV